jgi:hypothetical protein
MTLFGLAALLYAGSYLYLSRRGVEDAKRYGLRSFLYVPLDEVLRTQDLSGHYRRMQLYAPINALDRELFDGPDPCRCILFGLSAGQERPGGGAKRPEQ